MERYTVLDLILLPLKNLVVKQLLWNWKNNWFQTRHYSRLWTWFWNGHYETGKIPGLIKPGIIPGLQQTGIWNFLMSWLYLRISLFYPPASFCCLDVDFPFVFLFIPIFIYGWFSFEKCWIWCKKFIQFNFQWNDMNSLLLNKC